MQSPLAVAAKSKATQTHKAAEMQLKDTCTNALGSTKHTAQSIQHLGCEPANTGQSLQPTCQEVLPTNTRKHLLASQEVAREEMQSLGWNMAQCLDPSILAQQDTL